MDWLREIPLAHFFVFTLVLTRISGLVLVLPLLGTSDVPMQVRALLTLAVALLLTPLQVDHAVPLPENLVGYALLVGSELVIGVALGTGMAILFGGIQLAGQIVAQVSGLALADVFNPALESNMPILAHLLYLVASAVFLLIGGHRLVMEGLLVTFSTLPLGSMVAPTTVAETLTTLISSSFTLGIRAAAPATVAVLLATLAMGLVGRTLPQLNIMVVGFGVTSLVSFGALSISLGAACYLFEDQVEVFLNVVLEALHSGQPATLGP